MASKPQSPRPDVYARITDKIIADLEQGVRTWMRPWNADHAAGRITRPLRHNGIPYKGINVVMLWSAAVLKGHTCPLWLTFKQALELGGNVRKGETGELVVYADRIRRTETDAKGEEVEREIPFLKGYTVFNAEQCDGLPAHYYARPEAPALPLPARIEAADRFFAATGADNRRQRLPRNTALQGDCIEAMATMPAASVDFVLTDPPYITRYRDRSGRQVANDDRDDWLRPAFAGIHRLLKPNTFCVSFYGWNKADLFIAAYRWRQEYGGLQGDQVRRLKELEAENARLRRAVSDLTVEKLILKEAARGNF